MTDGEGSRAQSDAERATGITGDFAELAVEAVAGSPDQAWKMLGLINDWIKHAETKAAGTMAASGIAAGVLYNLLKDVSSPGKLIGILATVCVTLIVAAGLAAAWALRPRLWSRDAPTSNLYFDHIARRHSKKDGGDAFSETIRSLSAADFELVGEIAGQIWANAHVARAKYRWANIGLSAVLLALITLAATTLAVALTGC